MKRPNTHQIPNEICDRYMKDLSGSEFKVLYLIARKTCGFQKDVEALGTDRICRYTGLSKESVRCAVKSLEDRHLIEREIQKDTDSNSFADTLYWLAVEDDSEEAYPLPQKSGEGPLKISPPLPQKLGDPLPQNLGAIKGTKETSLKETIEREESTPPQPLEDIDLDTDIIDYVRQAYSRENRRAKLDNLRARANEGTCEHIRSKERELGSAEFRSALLTYLRDCSQWLIEKRWPVRAFLAQADRYIPDSVQTPRRARSGGAQQAAAPQPDLPQPPAAPRQPEPSFLERWNALVPEAIIDPKLLTGTQPAYSDPVFREKFDDICAACRKLIQAGAKLTYLNLFRRDRDTNTFWWQRVLIGDLDWMAPRSHKKQSLDVDDEVRRIDEQLAQYESSRAAGQTVSGDDPVGGSAGVP